MLDQCLRIALSEHQKCREKSWLHWSFVFQRNRLVEWGVNHQGEPTGYQRFGYHQGRHSVHSEVVAWRKASGLLDRRKPWGLINIRLGADGGLRMSKPCRVCEAYMRSCGCREVFYTTSTGFSRLKL